MRHFGTGESIAGERCMSYGPNKYISSIDRLDVYEGHTNLILIAFAK